MDKIDKYIEAVYRHLKGDSKELKVLKEEMKSHLIQTVKELQDEGKSEEESIEIAINRFGESEKINGELTSVFSLKKIEKKPLLFVAIAFLLLSIISYCIIYPIVYNQAKKSGEWSSQIVKLIDSSSFEDKQLLVNDANKILKEHGKNELRYFAIFLLPKDYILNPQVPISSANLEYIYPNNVAINNVIEDKDSFEGYFEKNNNQKWFVKVGVSHELDLYGTLRPIPYILFTLYLIIYFAWVILNVKELKSRNHMFGLTFLLLNIALILVALKVVGGMYIDNSFFEITRTFGVLGVMISIPAYLLLRMEYKYRLQNLYHS